MTDETNNLGQITSLLEDKELKRILREYRIAQGKMEERHFNVFTLSSDLYYRENFHSDIIKAFLDPDGAHQEGTLFLDVFIDMLNKYFPDKVSINKYRYKDATAEREPGRIDILIKSESTKCCIIIENKSNNARDTDNQLPNYWRKMIKAGYSVDAIVYIPLDENKEPDKSTWEVGTEEKEEIIKLLCIVPVYSQAKKNPNLVRDWVLLCSSLTLKKDCSFILSQFADLLKTLKNEIMDDQIMEKFYDLLKSNNNYHGNVQDVAEMNENLANYMARRLLNHFSGNKNGYGYDVYIYHDIYCVIQFAPDNNYYKIDIIVDGKSHEYTVNVFKQDKNFHYIDWCKNFTTLSAYGFAEQGESKEDDNFGMAKKFDFNEEDKVKKCVQDIIKDIQGYLLGLKSNDTNQNESTSLEG